MSSELPRAQLRVHVLRPLEEPRGFGVGVVERFDVAEVPAEPDQSLPGSVRYTGGHQHDAKVLGAVGVEELPECCDSRQVTVAVA